MRSFKVTLTHDKGIVIITVNAADEEGAVKTVMNAEFCPRRAIQKIQEIIREVKP